MSFLFLVVAFLIHIAASFGARQAEKHFQKLNEYDSYECALACFTIRAVGMFTTFLFLCASIYFKNN